MNLIDTPAFQRWFGDSKAVIAEGKPLVVYHGTTRNFSKFGRAGSKTRDPDSREGFFFSESPGIADNFTWERGSPLGGNIVPAFLSIKNPAVADFELVGGRSNLERAAQFMRQAKLIPFINHSTTEKRKGAPMGATVLDAVRVYSRKTATGEVAYLWQEETHDLRGDGDSNWCVMAFGNKADIIRRIYLMAESVASGMLKVGGQSVTAFVDAMLKKLDSPEVMTIQKVVLENTNRDTFYAAIKTHNRDAIRQYLREMGRLDLAEKIAEPGDSSQKVEFVLDDDFQALRGILNDVQYEGLDMNDRPCRGRGVAAWKAFPYAVGFVTHGKEVCGPTDEIKAVEQLARLDLEVYATDINVGYGNGKEPQNAFVAFLNGKLVYFGGIEFGHYQLTQALVKAALDVHLKTGKAVLRPLLKTLKKALESPKSLADDTVIRFNCEGYSDRWMKEQIGKVRALLGQDDDEQPQFSTTLGDLAKISSPSITPLRYVIDSVKAEFVLQGQPTLL